MAPAQSYAGIHDSLVAQGDRWLGWIGVLLVTVVGAFLIWNWDHVVMFLVTGLLGIPLVLGIGWISKWDESAVMVASGIVLVMALGAAIYDAVNPDQGSEPSDAKLYPAMATCVDRVMDAVAVTEEVDSASMDALNSAVRTALAACGEDKAPPSYRCDTQGCRGSGTGYSWNRVLRDWVRP